MEKIPTVWSFLLSCTLLLSIISASDVVEVEDEREFDYLRGSEKGPEHWGELKKEWETCKTGQLQSPIDLTHPVKKIMPTSATLNKFYQPERAVYKNRGHDIMIEFKGEGNKIQINGTEYILRQCHWHSPAEHTIDGQRFHAELHMVHKSLDNKIAVIGILYSIGQPDPLLLQITEKIMSVRGRAEEADAGMIDPSAISMGKKGYYRYIGSLTTPPCAEGVTWTVNKKIATISKEQLTLLRDAVDDHADQNSRPVQPRNGRKVQLYTLKTQ